MKLFNTKQVGSTMNTFPDMWVATLLPPSDYDSLPLDSRLASFRKGNLALLITSGCPDSTYSLYEITGRLSIGLRTMCTFKINNRDN